MIYEKMLEENQKLEKQIELLRARLQEFPEGKLICAANGKGYKWYRSDGKQCFYLPKKERKLAEKLAYKKYLSMKLEGALQEKRAVGFYLRHHDENLYETEQAFIHSPRYKELLAPFFIP